jgi:hypothetical protein
MPNNLAYFAYFALEQDNSNVSVNATQSAYGIHFEKLTVMSTSVVSRLKIVIFICFK